MEQNEKLTMTTIDVNGNKKTYDVLATYSCEELHKDYALLTDGTRDENGDIKITVGHVDDCHEDLTGYVEIYPVTDPDELELAEEAIELAIKKMQSGDVK